MQKTFEWQTFAFAIGVYTLWVGLLFVEVLWVAIPLIGVVIALQSSVQHELLHGHPFQTACKNAALGWVSLIIVIPYARFRDTHLAHHYDPNLTDPYEDPETNYFDPAVWQELSRATQVILGINNTLAGRLILGPLIGTLAFWRSEVRNRTTDTIRQWAWHLPAVAIVIGLVWISPMSLWSYAFATYIGMSLLKLRTFLEHQAADRASHRTAIIEQGGVFGFLFLNNHLHVVHHMHPRVPWYQLPRLYAQNRAHYPRRNGGYAFQSYGEVWRTYAWRAKDPVAHPIWTKSDRK